MLGTGWVGSALAQPKEFKIGFFIALSGPAALFGPTQRACADLAAEKINKAGGIMGRPVKLLFTDAGGPPAETAKSAVRLMLEDKVDLFIGSHDSATREANIATIKGKVPYIYSPVYEGGECSPNVYCLGETPPQQAQPAIEFLAKEKKLKTFHLIGDDYVWPRKVNEQVKKFVAAVRRQGGRRGVRAVRRAEQVRGGGDAHQGGQARRGGRAPWSAPTTSTSTAPSPASGSTRRIARLSLLLEENTLMGIGAENSANLYSCMGYFANNPSDAAKAFKAEYMAQVRREGAAAGDHRRRLLLGAQPRQGAVRQGRRRRHAQEADGRVRRPVVRHRLGPRDDARPPGRQGHVPGAAARARNFEVIKTMKGDQERHRLPRPDARRGSPRRS